jgi:hypothetical protein
MTEKVPRPGNQHYAHQTQKPSSLLLPAECLALDQNTACVARQDRSEEGQNRRFGEREVQQGPVEAEDAEKAPNTADNEEAAYGGMPKGEVRDTGVEAVEQREDNRYRHTREEDLDIVASHVRYSTAKVWERGGVKIHTVCSYLKRMHSLPMTAIRLHQSRHHVHSGAKNHGKKD